MSEGQVLRLVEMPRRAPLTDAAAHLRRLADAIEAGQYGENAAVAVVVERPYGDPPSVCGFGSAEEALRTYGLLSLGAQHLGALLLSGCVKRET